MSMVPYGSGSMWSKYKQLKKYFEPLNNEYGNFIRKQNEYARKNYGPSKKSSKKAAAKDAKTGGSAKFAESSGSGQMHKIRKKSSYKKKKVSLKKRVSKLEKSVKQNMATHVHKSESTLSVSSVSNRCGYGEGTLISPFMIESMLDTKPYINTGAPGTVSSYDATLIAVPTKWKISCYTNSVMRNNYLFPVRVRVYILKPKVDQSNSVQTTITNGLTEQTIGTLTSTTQVSCYPNDSKEFRDSWKVIKSQDFKLDTGDELSIPYKEDMVYDQEFRDQYTMTYTAKYSRLIFVRVVGVLTHDSTTSSNIGYAPTQLDCCIHRKFTLKFPSEAPTQSIDYSASLGAITTNIVGASSSEIENAL